GDTMSFYNPLADCDSVLRLAIDSTGIVQINNDTLRFYVAHPLYHQFINPDTIVVVEKLGVTSHYNYDRANGRFFTILPFFDCGMAAEADYTLRCYKDDESGVLQLENRPCE